MMASMRLRLARVEDVSALMAMERLPEYRAFVGNWTEELHGERMASADCRYLIAESESGEMSGFAILRGLASGQHSVRLQRIVVTDPNRGFGTLMMRGILDNVFQDLKAHRLWLDVFETNTRAQHVYERLGFRREGVLREAIFRDGEYHTQILMSILDREYEAAQSRQPGGTQD